MKKLLCILLALAMLTSLTLPSFAEDGTYFTDVNPDAAYYKAVKVGSKRGRCQEQARRQLRHRQHLHAAGSHHHALARCGQR